MCASQQHPGGSSAFFFLHSALPYMEHLSILQVKPSTVSKVSFPGSMIKNNNGRPDGHLGTAAKP